MLVDKEQLFKAIEQLKESQIELVDRITAQFNAPHLFSRLPDSDIVSEEWMQHFGNVLMIHHATSEAPFGKEKFEFGFIYASIRSGVDAEKPASRTNRGHDLTLRGVPISLKTQSDAGLRETHIHISKFMELGRGEWNFETLRDLFFEHMESYERIFTLRALTNSPLKKHYELVEIPKSLLLESSGLECIVAENSRQNPKPGHCHVYDENGKLKFSLYFDGGTERKLQIQKIDKSYCIVHGTWDFEVNKLF
ncbi:restriction endonuclease [Alcaligenaceae bacterium]|nr:restriction endonuclease [Alcaligenaceae bacterium]